MLTFPVDADTPAKRMEYTMRAQELLHLLHNEMGAWRREGISATRWGKLPAKIQAKYPYKHLLTETEWRDFLGTIFRVTETNISAAIGRTREELRQSTAWPLTIDEII